jgi:hypothetical protein
MSQDLDASKKKLEVHRAYLTKDLKHIENANKLLEGELVKLRENHGKPRASYEKALGTLRDPIVVENIACVYINIFYQALLIEENKTLN